jgi:3-hydroxyacyl-CoA dehydrogenase
MPRNCARCWFPSNDFAGFIGNGHFMRDGLHGIHEATRLTAELGYAQAIYAINKVTQDYLIRPMGIFQLIDYVGVEVCQYIMGVMNPYLENEDLHSDLLDKMVAQGITGGQYASGAQKDGFLKYEKGRPVAIWDVDAQKYVEIANFSAEVDAWLGDMPRHYEALESG